MLKIIQKIEDIITTRMTDTEVLDLVYVDFNLESLDEDEKSKIEFIAPNVATKEVQLSKIADKTNLFYNSTGIFIEKLRKLSTINEDTSPHLTNGKSIFGLDIINYDESEYRRLFTKLKLGSNYIATEGRIGPAQYMIISPFMMEKIYDSVSYIQIKSIHDIMFNGKDLNVYVMEYIGNISGVSVLVDDRISDNEILLYRKNNIDQPGLSFIWKKESDDSFKYDIVDIGFFPEKQCLKVSIN